MDVVGDHTSFVASDNNGGARLAVRHLHALGHTRIATIAGPSYTKPGADRILGYRAEMAELGLDVPRGYLVEGDFYPDSGETAMRSLLRLSKPPTAVFVAADMMAVGAIRAVQAAGRSVPGDVAIVGFDDISVAELLSPPLTTVRQNMMGIGLSAGRALIDQIENPDSTPPVLTLPVELVVRASCGAAAADR
jgi:LacI family transcriptional regulator